VVATISRLLKIIGLFYKRALQKRLYSAKETYNFEEPTNRSHPIPQSICRRRWVNTYIMIFSPVSEKKLIIRERGALRENFNLRFHGKD